MTYDYNTTRSPIILKEYGRNAKKIMDLIIATKDKNVRTKKAHNLVKLMETIVPKSELIQKLWDDLFILSDYQLDIDSPYPMHVKKDIHTSNFQLGYKPVPIKYKYYGRNIELLIHKISELTCPITQGKMIITVAKLMRRFSYLWNNEYISIERIVKDIQHITPYPIANIDIATLKAVPALAINNTRVRSTKNSKTMSTISTSSK